MVVGRGLEGTSNLSALDLTVVTSGIVASGNVVVASLRIVSTLTALVVVSGCLVVDTGGGNSVVVVIANASVDIGGGVVGVVTIVLLVGSGRSVSFRFAVAGAAGHFAGGRSVEEGLVLEEGKKVVVVLTHVFVERFAIK